MDKSESIKELATALAKFQGEVTNTINSKTVTVKTKTGSTYSYRYAPLDEVLNIIRPLLSKNGLSVLQSPINESGAISLTTTLLHNSGEWLEYPPLKLKAEADTPQGIGSAITYARRYTLSSILGMSSEDDNDANGGDHKLETDKPEPLEQEKTLSEKQINRLFAIGIKRGQSKEIIEKSIEKDYGKGKAEDLTKVEYDALCKRLEALPLKG